MTHKIEVLQSKRKISGCYYKTQHKLAILPITPDGWTVETKRSLIWTPPEDIIIPSTHNERFSAKKAIDAIFQYKGYRTVTPLSPTVKLFIYKGLDPHEDWTLVLLNKEISTSVTERDIHDYVYDKE